MGQRVPHQLEDLAVQLGVLTAHLQQDRFAGLLRQVAHQAGQLVPRAADRLHARLHHAVLQVRRDLGQALQGRAVGAGRALRRRLGARYLQQLVAREHQLADQGHQLFQHIHGHPDGLGGRFGGAGGRGGGHVLGGWRLGCGRGRLLQCGGLGGARLAGRLGFRCDDRGCCRLAGGHTVQLGDQLLVRALRLGAGSAQSGDDLLDAVQRGQHQADHRGGGRQLAVPHPAEHVLPGMGHALQTRQAEEAAGALDGVHQAEDQGERSLVAGIALQLDQSEIQLGQRLVRLGQEFGQEVIHGARMAVLDEENVNRRCEASAYPDRTG